MTRLAAFLDPPRCVTSDGNMFASFMPPYAASHSARMYHHGRSHVFWVWGASRHAMRYRKRGPLITSPCVSHYRFRELTRSTSNHRDLAVAQAHERPPAVMRTMTADRRESSNLPSHAGARPSHVNFGTLASTRGGLQLAAAAAESRPLWLACVYMSLLRCGRIRSRMLTQCVQVQRARLALELPTNHMHGVG
jgi:hypothetical protein